MYCEIGYVLDCNIVNQLSTIKLTNPTQRDITPAHVRQATTLAPAIHDPNAAAS